MHRFSPTLFTPLSASVPSQKAAIPFLAGVASKKEQQEKVSKLLFGRRKHTLHQNESKSFEHARPSLSTVLTISRQNEIDPILEKAKLSGDLNADSLSTVLQHFRKFNNNQSTYQRALHVSRTYETVTNTKMRASHFTLLMSIALGQRNKPKSKSSLGGGTSDSSSFSASSSSSSLSGGWREALRLFDVAFVRRQHKLSSPSVGAAFDALKIGGQWKTSVSFFEQVVFKDKLELDSKAVHAFVSQLRKKQKWELALSAFDIAAKNAGTQPDYLLYRELLFAIKDAALASQSASHSHSSISHSSSSPFSATTSNNNANSNNNSNSFWRFALQVAAAIEPVCAPNAGIYNTLIETCAISKNWRAGLRVFQHLQDRVVLSAIQDHSTRTIVNSQTITNLSALKPHDASFQIWIQRLARKHGLPIHSDVFRRLFISLDLEKRSDETLGFVHKLMEQAVIDPSNTGLALQPLLTGLLDSLVCHAQPEVAEITASFLKSSLVPILPAATCGCTVFGDANQSWILEKGCRVAVLDTGALLSIQNLSEALLEQFDAVMIPFSSVRSLVRRLQTEDTSSSTARTIRQALQCLRRLQQYQQQQGGGKIGGGAGPVQVMPLIHHLKALQLIAGNNNNNNSSDDNKTSEEDENLKFMLEQGENQRAEQERAEAEFEEKESKLKKRYCVLPGAASLEELIQLGGEKEDNRKNNKNSKKFMSAAVSNSSLTLSQNRGKQQLAKLELVSKKKSSSSLFAALRDKNPSSHVLMHPIAVAKMLSRLNPDSQVVVVWSARTVKDFCVLEGIEHLSDVDLVPGLLPSSHQKFQQSNDNQGPVDDSIFLPSSSSSSSCSSSTTAMQSSNNNSSSRRESILAQVPTSPADSKRNF